MKNVSRNKFLLCFRPVVDMDLVLETEGGTDRSRKNQTLKYIAAENNYSASEDNQSSKISKNSMVIRHPSQRTFSKVIKAVLFETILAKRVHDGKNLSQDSFKSSSGRSFSRQRSGDDKSVNRANSVDTLNFQEIKTNQVLFSQLSIGSSSSSCSTSTSLSEPKRQNQNSNNNSLVKRRKKDYMGSSSSLNYAIILLLLSLSFTILWGRLCAILFTSIWLYFVPRQSGSRPGDAEVRKLSKRGGSRDYRKRIIMEGLLERNHQREGALNF
ncbi:hypothetical protein Pint_02136 [Pistacia integerrima]|uniref:Uncharacterized protein n=1 Tax=Pistacia integerrima TaxID=434235 RepID=A0ACC0ZKY1_9ROSI|nr:hypothetical protein Pint_02136 [Pistacia integerrima]